MKLEDLENYRNDEGYIDMDKLFIDNPYLKDTILRESRGSHNREKDWVDLEDCSILLRTENMQDEGVFYTSYAELISEEVAKQVGIEAAHYDLIIYKGERGVLSKNVIEKESESLISASSLLSKLGKYGNTQDMLDFISVEDIFESFNYLYEYDDISKENILKLREDLCKLAIFDMFILNTDRNGANFAYIYDGDEKRVRLSPIFDNEHSLGGGISEDIIEQINMDKRYARIESDNLLPVIEPSEEAQTEISDDWEFCCPRYNERNITPLNWQTMIFYFESFENEKIESFFSNCYENIDINKAIKNVEERIKTEIPKEYKEVIDVLYEERKKYIGDSLVLGKDDFEYEDRN